MLRDTQPQTSVVAEDIGEPALASQSSTASSPRSFPEDNPIPTIENSPPHILELSDVMTPLGFTYPDAYESALDTTKEVVNFRNPYNFGHETQPSAFTFRSLHNTTPEPSARTSSITSPKIPGGLNLDLTGLLAGLAHVPPSLPVACGPTFATKLRASSKPAQPLGADTLSKLDIYNANDEAPPDEPYFNPEFQSALHNGKLVAQRIASEFEKCELARDHESHVSSIILAANELRKFDAPSVCTIGIVGDSGVGKSSLINSLLDSTGLARTAGLGAACTKVATEYRLRKPWHTAKYTIEMERMTNDEIDDQLRELLWSYRCFHIANSDGKDMTMNEQELLKKRSKQAWDTLQAAFASKEGLTEDYLKDTSPGADERIRLQLTTWTKELQWPEGFNGRMWRASANTVEEVQKRMEHSLSGILWPFITIVRVFLSSQVLKSGAVLTDLPGFHDSNIARVKAAEEYMYSCDEIFVVADITRASTNQNVEAILQESLGSNLKNGKPSQGIALICTKSEDLDVDEMREKFFANGTPEARRVEKLERKIEEIEADDTIANALRQRDEAQDELKYLCMTARINYVEKLIRTTHLKLCKDRRISVFCVSNKTYKENKRRSKIHDLLIKGSGIPALRSHCHKIPAQAQFRVAHHFLTIRLKALVQRVQLWLAGGSEETMLNNATIQKLLNRLRNDLQKTAFDLVFAARDTQLDAARDVMIEPMAKNLGSWTKESQEILSNLFVRFHHHTQLEACCRSYGSWGNEKTGGIAQWNLELIKPMVTTMDDWWNHYAESSAAVLVALHCKILELLNSLTSQVKGFQGAPLFAEALATKAASIKHTFAEAEAKMRFDLDSIKRDATTQDHQGSYISEEMRAVYLDCCLDNGPKVTARRRERFVQAVGTQRNPILFKSIRSRLQKALLELAQRTTASLDHGVSEALEQIGSNIEMLRSSEAKILANNGEFLEKLSEAVTKVMTDMKAIEEIAARVEAEAKTL